MNKPLLYVVCCSLVWPFFCPPCYSAPPDDLQHSDAAVAADNNVESVESVEAVEAKPAGADIVAPAAVAAATYHLQYRFAPGQRLRYETKQDTTMEAMVQESRTSDRTEVIQRRLFTVQSVDEQGFAHLTMQFEHVRMQRQANESPPVVFDSRMTNDEIPEMFRLMADRLKGSAVEYWLTSDGRPADVPHQTGAAGAVAPEDQKAASAGATFLMPLPSEPIRPGDSWKDTQTVKVRVTADINRDVDILRTFRLESVSDGIATIVLNTSIASSVSNPVVRSQLIQATPRGTLQFDIEKGVMISKQLRFDETVLNAMGQNSVVSSFGRQIEKLLPESAPELSAR